MSPVGWRCWLSFPTSCWTLAGSAERRNVHKPPLQQSDVLLTFHQNMIKWTASCCAPWAYFKLFAPANVVHNAAGLDRNTRVCVYHHINRKLEPWGVEIQNVIKTLLWLHVSKNEPKSDWIHMNVQVIFWGVHCVIINPFIQFILIDCRDKSHNAQKLSWSRLHARLPIRAIHFLLNKYIYLFIFTVAEGNKQLLLTVLSWTKAQC